MTNTARGEDNKSEGKSDGGGVEQFGGVVEAPRGVVLQHLHQQEGGEEGTSTTIAPIKEDSLQGGEERKKTVEEGEEKGKGSSGTSGTKIAGRTGKNN